MNRFCVCGEDTRLISDVHYLFEFLHVHLFISHLFKNLISLTIVISNI